MADARTENDALIELARSAAATVHATPVEHLHGVVLPPGHSHHVIDLERYQPEPRRKHGETTLDDAVSFSGYVTRHTAGLNGPQTPYALYADLMRTAVVAVLNDASRDAPGWGDHRAHLALQKTKPWLHWTGKDGKALPQEEFAEHIEKGLLEIAAPPALEMYELAQTFQATIGATFRQTGKLANGQRALHYEENVSATAGAQGDIEIPKEFQLMLAPFEGGQGYSLAARLRYRIRESKLTLSYHLVNPEDVLREAFTAELAYIESATGLTAFRGTPPV